MADSEIETILWAATRSVLGIEVLVSDIDGFKRRFYTARADAKRRGIFDFDELSCVLSPQQPTKAVWLMKPRAKINGETSEIGRENSGEGDGETPHGG